MRPHYSDAWHDIAAIAAEILADRRAEFRAIETTGTEPDAHLVQDGAAWAALVADWTYYTSHQRPHDRDATPDNKLAAIDREIARIEDLRNPNTAELRRRDLLKAMRWHTIPRKFGIAFCVSVTIEARRRRHANENHHNERNAA